MTVVRCSLCFEPKLLKEVDKRRGMIPRSAYVGKILAEHLKTKRR